MSQINFAIILGGRNTDSRIYAHKVFDVLTDLNCRGPIIDDLFLENESFGDRRKRIESKISNAGVIIAVGGDGTIIHTAKIASVFDIPILGINAGKLGFTAGLDMENLHLLKRLITGEYLIENRIMLSITLLSGSKKSSFFALNDAVTSAELSKIMDYNVAIGRQNAYNYRADGFIVATPTGSTAYSLSAGGPVIEPTMDCLVYTPICPHSLFNRSIIFGGDSELTVNIRNNISRVHLTIDGETPISVKTGDRLIFNKYKSTSKFILLGNDNFFDRLNKKILNLK